MSDRPAAMEFALFMGMTTAEIYLQAFAELRAIGVPIEFDKGR